MRHYLITKNPAKTKTKKSYSNKRTLTCHFRSTFYVAKFQTATAKMSAALKPLPLRPPNLGDMLARTFSCTQLQSLVPCDISRVAAMPRGKQLSPKTRGKIEALHSVGHSVRQIAAFVLRSRNSVHQCLQRLSHGSSDYENEVAREPVPVPEAEDLECR